MPDPEEIDIWNRPDIGYIKNGPVTMHHRPELFEAALKLLGEQGYRIHRFDCTNWNEESDCLLAVGKELEFTDFHGKSLDAFRDDLGDIEIRKGGGVVLAFKRFNLVANWPGSFAQDLIDIIAGEERLFLHSGRKLLAVLQSDNPHLQFNPVGAVSVDWGPGEEFTARRIGTRE